MKSKKVAWYGCVNLNRAMYECSFHGYAGKNKLLYTNR